MKRQRGEPGLVSKIFATFIGVAIMGFGAAMLAVGEGTGPCGRTCGIDLATVQLFGQAVYNLAFGMLWVVIGAVFVVFSWFRSRTVDRSKNRS